MAIRDLLWACPACGIECGLRRARGGERCASCGTTYRRGRGSTIVAQRPGRSRVVLPAATWVDRLPEIADRVVHGGRPPLHEEPVRVRFATGDAPIYHRGVYLNRIERFGPPRSGRLALMPDGLSFHADDGAGEHWSFDAITAVQPSSTTLQIKARGRGPASLRFPDGSTRFWEQLLTATLRRHYREAGRGEIVEFQPRIVTR
ncbi:MAG TPA: hypothetical protein VF188_04795 [Longimicrobiales bacterium]